MPQIPRPVVTLKPVMKDVAGYFSCMLYYDITGGSTFTQANIDAISQNVCNTLGPKFRALLCEQATLVHWYCRFRTASQDMEKYVTSGAAVGDGDVAGECLPTETCLEIQRRTGKPGRNMRGRIFMSGISEEGQSSGLIGVGSDTATAAQQLAASLGTDLTSTAFTLHARHWNRKTNTLEVVTECRPVFPLVSRRDRRPAKTLQPF